MANNTATAYGDGRPVSGGSFAAWPHGNQFTEAGPEPGLHYFTLDLEDITRIRRRWPYLDDIRKLSGS